MEFRKLTDNHGSIIIRVPRTWLKKNNLNKGDYVRIEELEDNSLKITRAE